MSKIAISYARFSSAGQGEGFSLARQVQNAEAYAAEHGLILDRSLSFEDLGVSAWDKSNIRKGALGLFLRAVEEGKVPPGATLIVESFDRLSRATPLDALAVFTQLISAGLHLVILTNPPKKFSLESVSANTFQLFEAILDMHRAHEESVRKSQLLGESWGNRRKRAVETKAVMTSKVPQWIVTTGTRSNKAFSIDEERAAVVRRVVELAAAGTGNHTIVKLLNAEGVAPWIRSAREETKRLARGQAPKAWAPSYVQKMLTSKALYGAVELKTGEVVEDYYPPLITYGEYVHLQSVRRLRGTRKASNRLGPSVTNLFSGLLRCGYCSSTMALASYVSRRTGERVVNLACYGARTGGSSCRMHGWLLDEFEKDVLFWLTQVDYNQVVGVGHAAEKEEQERLALFERELADVQAKVENTMRAIEEGAKSMVPRLQVHEEALENLRKAVEAQRLKVGVLMAQGGGGSRPKALIELFKALKHTTDPLKLRTLREQLCAAINLVVEKITLYPVGRRKQGKDERCIDILFRNGATRTLEAPEC